MSINELNIAIVCDWLTVNGGAEKVILALHKLFPNAPIYTTIYNPEKVKGFEDAEIRTSYLQNLPFSKSKHQLYLNLMPGVFEGFNLDKYDIVISSSHSCAKGVITKPETLHLCYCHSPMRYAWEDSINYINEYEINGVIKKIAPWIIHKIRLWDRVSAERVDQFITNSRYIQNRVRKYYRKESEVIYPFIDTDKFKPDPSTATLPKENFYLAVGRLTPYKKFDLIVEAFNQNGLPLKIVGTGIVENKLKNVAKDNIEFLGHIPDEHLIKLYRTAKGLVFPQLEDFGIIPLEAMACGCPVIAFGKGGALETVKDGKTGVFFHEQTVESLIEAIDKFDSMIFDYSKVSKYASAFNREQFNTNILRLVKERYHRPNVAKS